MPSVVYAIGGVVYIIIVLRDKVFNIWFWIPSYRASILLLVCYSFKDSLKYKFTYLYTFSISQAKVHQCIQVEKKVYLIKPLRRIRENH